MLVFFDANRATNLKSIIKMKAKQAYESQIHLECTCINISPRKWDKLMEGAKKANGAKIRTMIKNQIPELYSDLALNFYNPYEHQSKRTNTHLIYIHSGIEYFLRLT